MQVSLIHIVSSSNPIKFRTPGIVSMQKIISEVPKCFKILFYFLVWICLLSSSLDIVGTRLVNSYLSKIFFRIGAIAFRVACALPCL